MSATDVVLLVAAGLAAGGVNAVAGGGSLISFPALLAVGLPSVAANVTNAVAVLPGYLGGTVAYREELGGQRARALSLGVTAALGSVAGAVLLIALPEEVFDAIVPVLILAACALLAAQPRLSRRFEPRSGQGAHRSVPLHLATFATAAYGGFFGAGLGIMLLAVLALTLDDHLQRLNALKGLLAFVTGAAAVAFFAFFGPVDWTAALVMAATAFAGGHLGVSLARRLPADVLRWGVVGFGVCAAVWLALFD